jgi:hypothetical protein
MSKLFNKADLSTDRCLKPFGFNKAFKYSKSKVKPIIIADTPHGKLRALAFKPLERVIYTIYGNIKCPLKMRFFAFNNPNLAQKFMLHKDYKPSKKEPV